jgi:rubrerythrin
VAAWEFAEFLAHSLELESEARERYAEMADIMEVHHNREVAAFFQRMTREAGLHLEEVTALAAGLALPRLNAWEYGWPGAEPPETSSYEALHYRMSLRQGIELALGNERAAERFYSLVAEEAVDERTRRTARQFAVEEASHAAALERMLAELPANGELLREEDDEPTMPE